MPYKLLENWSNFHQVSPYMECLTNLITKKEKNIELHIDKLKWLKPIWYPKRKESTNDLRHVKVNRKKSQVLSPWEITDYDTNSLSSLILKKLAFKYTQDMTKIRWNYMTRIIEKNITQCLLQLNQILSQGSSS
jgi:CO dehydrogenase/acetyl-CoA synthase gamma subunit (corrinoid Fe-S protein)